LEYVREDVRQARTNGVAKRLRASVGGIRELQKSGAKKSGAKKSGAKKSGAKKGGNERVEVPSAPSAQRPAPSAQR